MLAQHAALRTAAAGAMVASSSVRYRSTTTSASASLAAESTAIRSGAAMSLARVTKPKRGGSAETRKASPKRSAVASPKPAAAASGGKASPPRSSSPTTARKAATAQGPLAPRRSTSSPLARVTPRRASSGAAKQRTAAAPPPATDAATKAVAATAPSTGPSNTLPGRTTARVKQVPPPAATPAAEAGNDELSPVAAQRSDEIDNAVVAQPAAAIAASTGAPAAPEMTTQNSATTPALNDSSSSSSSSSGALPTTAAAAATTSVAAVVPPPTTTSANRSSLQYKFPRLAEEYLATNPIPAGQVHPELPTRVDWKCRTCAHVWQQSLFERTVLRQECPRCTSERPLSEISELLSKELHPTRNDPFLTPDRLTILSRAMLWWRCSNCQKDFQARVRCRVQKPDTQGACPHCRTTERSTGDHDILQREWHPTKNGDLDCRSNLSAPAGSSLSRQLVWWICPCCAFEWQAAPTARLRGYGMCPSCNPDRAATKAGRSNHRVVPSGTPTGAAAVASAGDQGRKQAEGDE